MGSTKVNMDRKVELIGKEFETSKSGKCFVIGYKDSGNVLVMFYKPLYITKCAYSSLIKGFVENPFFPSVYGRGYIGIGKFSCKDVEVQRIWRNLMSRAYCDEYHKNSPTYKDVEVCREWHNFQNFAEWCVKQKGFNSKGLNGRNFALDKDILSKNGDIYSPETCCFVPQEINTGIMTRNNGLSNVRKTRNRWSARISKYGKYLHLGTFYSQEEASQAYISAKESYVREMAKKWKDEIDENAYESLMHWKVSKISCGD